VIVPLLESLAKILYWELYKCQLQLYLNCADVFSSMPTYNFWKIKQSWGARYGEYGGCGQQSCYYRSEIPTQHTAGALLWWRHQRPVCHFSSYFCHTPFHRCCRMFVQEWWFTLCPNGCLLYIFLVDRHPECSASSKDVTPLLNFENQSNAETC
jgi:hypothetical protein